MLMKILLTAAVVWVAWLVVRERWRAEGSPWTLSWDRSGVARRDAFSIERPGPFW